MTVDLALITESRPLPDIVRIVQAAEAAGVGTFWLTEGTALDVFAVLSVLASHTERIHVGTGIAMTFSRTPLAIAQAANTVMQFLGPDRVLHLGLGSSGKALVEKFYGVPFETPMARLDEYVRTIDHIFTTGRVPGPQRIFRSQDVAVSRRGALAARDRLRIYVAGLNPRSIEIAGTSADGWLPIWPSISSGRRTVEELHAAASAAHRRAPRVSAYVYGVVSDDPALVELVRATLAWYIAANGVVYANLFRRRGYEAQVDRIVERWAAGDRDAARAAVDQDMFEDVALFGDRAVFARRVEEFRTTGIDDVILQFPPTTPTADVLAMIDALPRR